VEEPVNDEQPVSPAAEMLGLLSGSFAAQAIHVAARLGLSDLLADGRKRVEELAAKTGAHAPSLHRLLRYLASLNVVCAHPDRSFSLTRLGDTLRADNPYSMRAAAIFYGTRCVWGAAGELYHRVKTGQEPFVQAHGLPFFEYLAAHREDADAFEAWMTRLSEMQVEDVLAAYDFSEVSTLVDVGGGRGTLLARILAVYPQLRGILFDAPSVVERATWVEEMSGRCRRIGGDFFESVPGGGDAYLLQHILHDWEDEMALRLLRNCRRAVAEGTRLLVIEMLVPEGRSSRLVQSLDMLMMALPGGRERTQGEFARLFDSAGFQISRAISIGSPLWILEGVAV
jgi:SAM-dependent methyltransferase